MNTQILFFSKVAIYLKPELFFQKQQKKMKASISEYKKETLVC